MFHLGHPFFVASPVLEASSRAGFGAIFRPKIATARFGAGKGVFFMRGMLLSPVPRGIWGDFPRKSCYGLIWGGKRGIFRALVWWRMGIFSATKGKCPGKAPETRTFSVAEEFCPGMDAEIRMF